MIANAPKLRRTKEGRLLCVPHYLSGSPQYHTEGCAACAEARAKGIVRRDITTVKKRDRCKSAFGRGFMAFLRRPDL